MDMVGAMKKLMVVMALVGGSAQAEFYSGNEILQRMQADSHIERAVALGFVAGVADAWDGIMFCPPESVTTGQARDVALRFLIINPGKRHRPAAELVMDALAESWPCARKPNKGGKL